MPKTEGRVAEMAAMRSRGMTLAEVGETFGLTRERVRQLLLKGGYQPASLKKLATASRAQRDANALRQELTNHRGEIRQLLLDGEQIATIAGRLAISRLAVRKVDRELGGVARHAVGGSSGPKYTDVEVLHCLQRASEALGGILTGEDYNGVAEGRRLPDGREWPGKQTAILRFGSWRDALMAAGLAQNRSSAVRGKRLFEQGHCIDAILEVTRALGRLPTHDQYSAYAASMDGILPSVSTIRNRLGGWTTALQVAARFNASDDVD